MLNKSQIIHSIDCKISEKWWLEDKYLQQTTLSRKDVEKGFDAIIRTFGYKWLNGLPEEVIIKEKHEGLEISNIKQKFFE
ncbi:MAG: hypothetical protein AABZ11_00465 [Nitrospinota bacterium]